LECYQMSKVVTCKPEEKFCYSDVFMPFRNHIVYTSGCSSYCRDGTGEKCCTTDRCNGARGG
nr:toxin CM2a [Naja haje]